LDMLRRAVAEHAHDPYGDPAAANAFLQPRRAKEAVSMSVSAPLFVPRSSAGPHGMPGPAGANGFPQPQSARPGLLSRVPYAMHLRDPDPTPAYDHHGRPPMDPAAYTHGTPMQHAAAPPTKYRFPPGPAIPGGNGNGSSGGQRPAAAPGYRPPQTSLPPRDSQRPGGQMPYGYPEAPAHRGQMREYWPDDAASTSQPSVLTEVYPPYQDPAHA
jgi:hypothetical protein